MNLVDTCELITGKKFTEEQAKEFALKQFGLVAAFIRKYTGAMNIGDKVFAIRKEYLTNNHNGARIIPATVKYYERRKGKVVPIFDAKDGSKITFSIDSHEIFVSLPEAIKVLKR